MRLTEKQGEIIYCAQLRANATVAQLRSLTGYREHTIRYALNTAVEDGLIRAGCFINMYLLGFTQYEIYFSLSGERRYSRERLLEAIVQCEKISWAGEMGGEYNYGVNLCVRNIQEVADFLEHLSASVGLIYLERAFAARISLSFFGNKYLRSSGANHGKLSYGATYARVSIDETDHRILKALVLWQNRSRRDIARALEMPFSTLENRIKRLEKSGVVVGYYYQVLSEMLGVHCFLILLSVKGFDAERKKKLFKFCETHPNVVVLIESVGAWDFELAVEVYDAREVVLLVEELQAHFSAHLHSVKVLPSFSYPKVREYPLDDYSLVR